MTDTDGGLLMDLANLKGEGEKGVSAAFTGSLPDLSLCGKGRMKEEENGAPFRWGEDDDICRSCCRLEQFDQVWFAK